MRSKALLWLSNIFMCIAMLSSATSSAAARMGQEQAIKAASEVYIYGYPLVTAEMTRRVMTNSVKATETHAPMGQFTHARHYPDASFNEVTTPNADTLYSNAWVDLSKEPYILLLPDEGDRYYLMPILSAWTNVIAAPGSRTTGTKAQRLAIVGPRWRGTLPPGVTEVESPTNLVWIIGRTYANGSPADYKIVHALQDQYQLVPLSAYGKDYKPAAGVVDPNIDMKTPVRDQVNKLSAEQYFKTLLQLMKQNPAAPEDSAIVAKMAKLGLVPGQEFSMRILNPSVAKSLEKGMKIGQAQILAQQNTQAANKNGWKLYTPIGDYDTHYLDRAVVSAFGLGANLPEDAVYMKANTDHKNKPLNGAHKYVLHLKKNDMPPVKGFWSITLYNDHFFFVENPLNRYAISQRTSLKTNVDGSIDMYIQHDFPGKEKEPNWLPAPKGDFVLIFRAYWPEQAILNGNWNPPPIQVL